MCFWFILKRLQWSHPQLVHWWLLVHSSPPHLLLLFKTQEQVFTGGSKKVCLLFFSSFALRPIYLLLKIDSWCHRALTHTLHSCYTRFELAMGTYCALSWKVHHTYPQGTKMCVVTASDRHIFFGQCGKRRRRSKHYFCIACNQGYTWFTVIPYLTVGRASSTLCSWDSTQKKVVRIGYYDKKTINYFFEKFCDIIFSLFDLHTLISL